MQTRGSSLACVPTLLQWCLFLQDKESTGPQELFILDDTLLLDAQDLGFSIPVVQDSLPLPTCTPFLGLSSQGGLRLSGWATWGACHWDMQARAPMCLCVRTQGEELNWSGKSRCQVMGRAGHPHTDTFGPRTWKLPRILNSNLAFWVILKVNLSMWESLIYAITCDLDLWILNV